MTEASKKKRLLTNSAWIARRRERVRKSGLCITCLKKKPATGSRVCDSCNRQAKERVARHRAKKRDAAVTKQLLQEDERMGDEASIQHFYRDAIGHFEKALGVPSIESSDRLRLTRKLASVCFLSGDSETADRWTMLLLDQLGGSRTEKVAELLLKFTSNQWLACRTGPSLPFLAHILQSAQSDPTSDEFQFANLKIAETLLELGHYNDAKNFIDAIGTANSSKATHFALFLRGIYLASLGKSKEAFASFENALAFDIPYGGKSDATTIHEKYNTGTILEDYGVWALALGDIELAKNCYQRAILNAPEQQAPWFMPYISLRRADVFARMGQYESACEFLEDAIAYDIRVERVTVMIAIIGIPIALRLNNSNLLRKCANPAAIDLAFQSGEQTLIGQTAASFAQFFVAQGRLLDAQTLVHRALGAVRHLVLHWELAIEAASVCAEADIRHARALLEEGASLPSSEVAQAFLSFFDAIVANRRGHSTEERAAAKAAGEKFAALQWHGYVDRVKELVKKTRPPGTIPSGLTLREKQVAELVSKGLTNREIATKLAIGEHTVETHMTSIMSRLGIRSRHQLIDLLDES